MHEWNEMASLGTGILSATKPDSSGGEPVGPVGLRPAEVRRAGGTPARPTDWKSVPRYTKTRA
jgi:hypothetical protein